MLVIIVNDIYVWVGVDPNQSDPNTWMPDMMRPVPKSWRVVITSLKNRNPVRKRATVSAPAMTTRMFPRGALDEIPRIQKKFPMKNRKPAAMANASWILNAWSVKSLVRPPPRTRNPIAATPTATPNAMDTPR